LRVPYLRAPLDRRIPRGSAVRVLRRLTRRSAGELRAYLREVDGDPFVRELARHQDEYRRLNPAFAAGTIHPTEGALLYALVRALRPATVVETGTANGASTTYLLAALARNDNGRMVSIDLPFFTEAGELQGFVEGSTIDLYDASPVPTGKEPGWMVPDDLRGRWELRLGDAHDLLPVALQELGPLQLFFHDSLHTREHMRFEFETAWPGISPGGVLASDDVFQRKHDALPAFAASVGRPFSTFSNLGFVGKR
jgi:predicted O-methyltransferase YrrM